MPFPLGGYLFKLFDTLYLVIAVTLFSALCNKKFRSNKVRKKNKATTIGELHCLNPVAGEESVFSTLLLKNPLLLQSSIEEVWRKKPRQTDIVVLWGKFAAHMLLFRL